MEGEAVDGSLPIDGFCRGYFNGSHSGEFGAACGWENELDDSAGGVVVRDWTPR